MKSQTQGLGLNHEGGSISLKGMGELSWATLPAFHQSGRFRAPSLLRTCSKNVQALGLPSSCAHINLSVASQSKESIHALQVLLHLRMLELTVVEGGASHLG